MNEGNNITVPTSHAKYLKEFYEARLGKIEKEALELKTLLKDLDSNVNGPNGQLSRKPEQSDNFFVNPPEAVAFPKTYNARWSNQKKAQFVIRAQGKSLTSGEIVDIIVDKYEPETKPGRRKLLGSVSSVLSGNSKPGGIFSRTKNDLDDWIYDVAKK